ncbi:bifunctional helix-turn-helix domain-containing protein/methylated-DNA--[protein]-cysteine S-methyltransferase [Sphingobacterium corticis]
MTSFAILYITNNNKMEQMDLNYQRIATAIRYVSDNFKRQPSLEEIADQVHLSPTHFQRLFTDWAGVTPKQFLQFVSTQHAKTILNRDRSTLFETAMETGLSSTSRLHDLFIKMEGMTPAEYKNGGRHLSITYRIAISPFGNILIATTKKGICHMAFLEEDAEKAISHLKSQFPEARFIEGENELQNNALRIFQQDWREAPEIKLHLKGTAFQLHVWQCLLKIPFGSLSSYGTIAQQIGNPSASRAVGTAIGKNPIAFLIPCHRVIQSAGELGGYMWGKTRKKAIIGWEAAKEL